MGGGVSQWDRLLLWEGRMSDSARGVNYSFHERQHQEQNTQQLGQHSACMRINGRWVTGRVCEGRFGLTSLVRGLTRAWRRGTTWRAIPNDFLRSCDDVCIRLVCFSLLDESSLLGVSFSWRCLEFELVWIASILLRVVRSRLSFSSCSLSRLVLGLVWCLGLFGRGSICRRFSFTLFRCHAAQMVLLKFSRKVVCGVKWNKEINFI